ncbi:MAG: hypothetical protein AYL32_011680 [Candidatus Bathyarchaeota archaeon B26-2]|nr:MAG: hypothetical protein AYL32_011680 [Candidatus Bathyarchaeota archaeon B26-2]
MLICGIDDAGRGAVIGPLVIVGVLIEEKGIHRLVELGVKDSKMLTPKRREHLAKEILKTVKDYYVVKLKPSEIDRVVKMGRKLHKLNRLEAQAMAEVIRRLKPDVVYVDASDVSAERFGRHILEEVPFKVQIVSRHKADRIYPIVSAASIVAKVERDREIFEIRKRYGDVGSGYAADPKTINFLEEWIKAHGSYPDFVRKSWKTARRLKSRAEPGQSKLL